MGLPPAVVLRSAGCSAGVALCAVVLGLLPARLLACGGRRAGAVAALLLAPLLLPRYLMYYAWTLLADPAGELGRWLARDIATARGFAAGVSALVLLLWYWPLAAMMLALGWRRLDGQTWQSARLDGGAAARWFRVALPMMGRAIVLTWCVCFVMSLSEFATFDLAGMETIGTELARLYLETGSPAAVAWAAWPATAVAAGVAALLWRRMRDWSCEPALAAPAPPRGTWALTAGLLALSVGVPAALLVRGLASLAPLERFWTLHRQELSGSLAISGAGALAATALAGGALAIDGRGRAGRVLAAAMNVTILLALLIPGSILGAGMVELSAALDLPATVRQSWLNVSAGQAARLSGVVLLVLMLARDARDRHLAEMAAVDGASASQTWWHVHWPRIWPWALAAAGLAGLLGLTELQVSVVLLPAGAPSFARWLLNQMHYAWEQDVITGCLVLLGAYALLAGGLLALLRLAGGRTLRTTALAAGAVLLGAGLAGCDGPAGQAQTPRVARTFGRTGRGGAEFVYPRAIDRAEDGTLWVVDKTGRVQHLSDDGRFLGQFTMPSTEAGYPVGITAGHDGRVYVADTHYHRVMIYHGDGTPAAQIGSHGRGPGQFIFPTDVAVADDGRIFVSEYGGNDRVSVFSPRGEFLFSFGSFGEGPGQFSRPASLCIDRKRGRLYVADACNHRIVVYDLSGNPQGELGSLGQGPGQLRYPYGLAVADDGRLVVCEYGNNRIQVLEPDGRCVRVLGGPGRQPGQLAYPWAVAVDGDDRAYVLDSGNNRVQVWAF